MMGDTPMWLAHATALLATVNLQQLAAADPKSWDFRGVGSKEEARQRAAGLASLNWNEERPGGRDTQTMQDMFQDWAQEQGLNFDHPSDRAKAFRNFRLNMKKAININLDSTKHWWAGGNSFSHLSHDEFAATYLMKPDSIDAPPIDPSAAPTTNNRKLQQFLPADWNWRSYGKVTPVRNQGPCGCCWAFAATSAMESLYLIRNGGDPNGLHLSEQQLISCIYSNGCNGGSPLTAMNYVAANNQTTDALYPYTSGSTRVGGTCLRGLVSSLQPGQAVKTSAGPKGVSPTQNEVALRIAVAAQPVAFYFAVNSAFQQYVGGIFNGPASGCTTAVNHAMLNIGFSTTSSDGSYWIVKNSWGIGWGEAGYVRIRFTGDGAGPCGMYNYPMIPAGYFTKTLSTLG